MKKRAALVLIDLQSDFLELPRVEPHPSSIVAGAARVLQEFRGRRLPVIHVRTQTALDGVGRMPHWQQRGNFSCSAGSAGYEAPVDLTPVTGEAVFDKAFFSAFSVSMFEEHLKELGIETLVLGGIFIQSCLRQTALEGYARGYRVYLATEAIGSHDPLHGALTLSYLDDRAITPLDTPALLHAIEVGDGMRDHTQPALDLEALVAGVRRVQPRWAKESMASRVDKLNLLASQLEKQKEPLAQLIVTQVKKPIEFARGEVARSVALLRAVADRSAKTPLRKIEKEGQAQLRARGIVAMITPWNNPLAIPIGKLAPALAYGNAVLWKPSPHAVKVAHAVMPLILHAGFPEHLVDIVEGDERQARRLLAADIDAVAFSGSSRTGWSIIAQAASRLLPIQAELGGNNGAVVTRSADLKAAAVAIVEGAFGFAGQRCTANRRAIVVADVYDSFVETLEESMGQLCCGDPEDAKTLVTPMITARAAQAAAALVERARNAGLTVLQSHVQLGESIQHSEAFYPPTLILCDEPETFIVQEESFAPILVVQKARDFGHAVHLLNAVPYGLVAAIFSKDDAERERFLEMAEAGVLKLNASTVNAGVDLPFTGWKHSGYGAAEHGEANAEFFTKRQAIYL